MERLLCIGVNTILIKTLKNFLFFLAARWDRDDVVAYLLSKGSKHGTKSNNGQTALDIGKYRRSNNYCQRLISFYE